MQQRGILLHISSLPSYEDIGTLGEGARRWVDFLAAAKQDYWQVLPVGHTGFGDSPYQTFSVYAGNPYFVDKEHPAAQGAAPLSREGNFKSGNINYGKLYISKYKALRKLNFCKLLAGGGYDKFCRDNAEWLDDYALFMAIKDSKFGASWDTWEDELRFRRPEALRHYRDKLKGDTEFWKGVQYLFFKQWADLRGYANGKNIKIIGDMPIYTAFDSADVWAHPGYFRLDGDLRLREVAGVPPDYFSEKGQIWGNPLYNWDTIKADGYKFWADRLRGAAKLYDSLRIDHFRGFAGYFVIDADADTAAGGHWEQGPGAELFDRVKELGLPLEIIAEDLGTLTPDVYELMERTGYAGMKVLQFALGDDDNPYLPNNYTSDNCVVYTGTHDNPTTAAWYRTLDKDAKAILHKYLKPFGAGCVAHKMIKWAYGSRARTAIIPMQDALNLGSRARMNIPSTASGNWKWRMGEDGMSEGAVQTILELKESK